jgi:thioredoxin reductase
VVIGGGAAGLSAAMVLARARRKVLVVDAGNPRNAPAAHLHGYLSRDGLAPAELLNMGRLELRGYGGRIVEDTVVRAERCEEHGFQIELASAVQMTTRRMLVTTGLRDELPDITGLHDRWARDVLHCPYCHGYEVRDQKLGILGGPAGSVHYAQIVRQWSNDVVYFAPAGSVIPEEHEQLVARAIGVVEGDVARVVVEGDRLRGVELGDGRFVARDALFVPPRFVPNNGVLVELGCDLDENGWVVTDPNGQTTVPGVWVAGNVTNPRAQVITAAGEGSAAAIAVNADLVNEDIQTAVQEFSGRSRC